MKTASIAKPAKKVAIQKPTAEALLVDRRGKVVLVQLEHTAPLNGGKWVLPGAALDKVELPVKAVLRGLKENLAFCPENEGYYIGKTPAGQHYFFFRLPDDQIDKLRPVGRALGIKFFSITDLQKAAIDDTLRGGIVDVFLPRRAQYSNLVFTEQDTISSTAFGLIPPPEG